MKVAGKCTKDNYKAIVNHHFNHHYHVGVQFVSNYMKDFAELYELHKTPYSDREKKRKMTKHWINNSINTQWLSEAAGAKNTFQEAYQYILCVEYKIAQKEQHTGCDRKHHCDRWHQMRSNSPPTYDRFQQGFTDDTFIKISGPQTWDHFRHCSL